MPGTRRAGLRKADSRRTGLRKADLRMPGVRREDSRRAGLRKTDLRGPELPNTDPRADDLRMEGLRVTDLSGKEGGRMQEARRGVIRTTGTATPDPRTDDLRTAGLRVTDLREDSSREEEAAAQMADLRATDKMDFREMADRALTVLRVIGVVRAAARAAAVVLTVHCAITVAMLDREIDLEITDQARALAERLRPRTWKRGAMKIRDALTARKRTNAPRRIIFTKKTRR